MYPAILTILAWEKKLEIQRQDLRKNRDEPGLILPEGPKPLRESRKSILDWIPWIGSVRPQPPCECS